MYVKAWQRWHRAGSGSESKIWRLIGFGTGSGFLVFGAGSGFGVNISDSAHICYIEVLRSSEIVVERNVCSGFLLDKSY